jgi:hypothetical protein
LIADHRSIGELRCPRKAARGSGRQVSLAKFVQDFLVFAEANYRPGTVALYRHTLSRIQLVTGDISLPEVSAEHFDKYKSKRLTQ